MYFVFLRIVSVQGMASTLGITYEGFWFLYGARLLRVSSRVRSVSDLMVAFLTINSQPKIHGNFLYALPCPFSKRGNSVTATTTVAY